MGPGAALAAGVAGSLPAQALNGIFAGSIYALFAVGYTLVFGVLDILNLAHSAVFMLGAVFAYGSDILGADLYDRPGTLLAYWNRLVRAYALDALERPRPPNATVGAEAVCAWVRSAAAAKAEAFRSPGLGEDVRLQGPNVAGAGLVVDGQPVHVELFPWKEAPAE